jgi:hypothetical protein
MDVHGRGADRGNADIRSLFCFLVFQPPEKKSVFDLERGFDPYFFSESDLHGLYSL